MMMMMMMSGGGLLLLVIAGLAAYVVYQHTRGTAPVGAAPAGGARPTFIGPHAAGYARLDAAAQDQMVSGDVASGLCVAIASRLAARVGSSSPLRASCAGVVAPSHVRRACNTYIC